MSEQSSKNGPRLELLVGATGVVFGDIGTSPLYAFRESFTGHHKLPLDQLHVLSVLSMIFWALLLVVTIKYVLVTMRADNRGEGGSLALLALIARVTPTSPLIPSITAAALLATALFYGDAIITPAISILSAVEGVNLLNPALQDFVIPATLAIVVALFSFQRFGTQIVAGWFGPIMLVWFTVIGGLGLWHVIGNPIVLEAVNPQFAIHFIVTDPVRAFFTLGTIVLAVTGAEALYADMGHFGRAAITRAWLLIALPALLLCYAGQSALVLHDPEAIENPFFAMAPKMLLGPLVLLATLATVIASQSIISGAFSVTQQAILLGYLPRMKINHTSAETRGQVYAPGVNLMLLVAVIILVLWFRSSSALASAYGLAVTATMVLTTLMIGFVVFRIWKWNILLAVPLFTVLLLIDVGLFASSVTKFADGGWLPLSVAAALVFVFATWRKGMTLLRQQLATTLAVTDVVAANQGIYRPKSTAIYLTSDCEGVPAALLHNIQVNHVLHEHVLLVTAETALKPYIDHEQRMTVDEHGAGIVRVVVRYGFAEQPDIPEALSDLSARFNWLHPRSCTYFLSRQTIVATDKPGMALWRERLFGIMLRNTQTPLSFFKLPPNRVVELGSQVEI